MIIALQGGTAAFVADRGAEGLDELGLGLLFISVALPVMEIYLFCDSRGLAFFQWPAKG